MSTEHALSVRLYAAVFAALIVLTLTTAGIAFVDLGGNWNTVAALAIASCKALLVLLYFMHLRYSRPFSWVFAGIGFFWLAILLTLTLSDVLTRS